jgi:hypothetical protein
MVSAEVSTTLETLQAVRTCAVTVYGYREARRGARER